MGLVMKRKLLALSLFSLCSLAVFAGESQAFFGLFSPYHPWHPHNRYVTHITCRPYNAFTPICWGNLVCDGCNPSPCGVASGCLPLTMGAPPWAGSCGPMMGGACGPNGCMASDMPVYQPAPMPAINNQQQQPFKAPMPNPLPMGPNSTMFPYSGVSQANFNPMPYPNYYQPNYYQPNYYQPTYYNPYMNMPYTPAPSYWYGR